MRDPLQVRKSVNELLSSGMSSNTFRLFGLGDVIEQGMTSENVRIELQRGIPAAIAIGVPSVQDSR